MSAITGSEPGHWHYTDSDGRVHHKMTDPRQWGISEAHLSSDEKAYAAHLARHEELAASGTPLPDDDPLVRSILEYLTVKAQEIATMRELVMVLRSELADGTPFEQTQAGPVVKQTLPELFHRVPDRPAPTTTPGETQ